MFALFILGLIVLARLAENIKYWKFSIKWWTLIFPVGKYVFSLITYF